MSTGVYRQIVALTHAGHPSRMPSDNHNVMFMSGAQRFVKMGRRWKDTHVQETGQSAFFSLPGIPYPENRAT